MTTDKRKKTIDSLKKSMAKIREKNTGDLDTMIFYALEPELIRLEKKPVDLEIRSVAKILYTFSVHPNVTDNKWFEFRSKEGFRGGSYHLVGPAKEEFSTHKAYVEFEHDDYEGDTWARFHFRDEFAAFRFYEWLMENHKRK